jgi:hypothetical protein
MRLPSLYWLGIHNSTTRVLRAVKMQEAGNKNDQITMHVIYYI